jgi:hypothetical protein
MQTRSFLDSAVSISNIQGASPVLRSARVIVSWRLTSRGEEELRQSKPKRLLNGRVLVFNVPFIDIALQRSYAPIIYEILIARKRRYEGLLTSFPKYVVIHERSYRPIIY